MFVLLFSVGGICRPSVCLSIVADVCSSASAFCVCLESVKQTDVVEFTLREGL